MIRNYFKIAWRNLVKSRAFSVINISGLAIGLSCFLLIALYVTDELSYDRYHEKSDRTYRLNADISIAGNDLKLATVSDAMGEILQKDYPQVETSVRFFVNDGYGYKLIKKGNDYLSENSLAHVDSTLFDVFSWPLIHGDPHTALDQPNSVVISEKIAQKYFGSTDVVGKTLETKDNGGTTYKVTGVMKDIPENSHIRMDFFFSMANVHYQWNTLLSHNFVSYIVLKKGTDYKAFEKNMATYIDKYVLPEAKKFMQINSIDEFRKAGNRIDYFLTPVTDIHLHSARTGELGVNGNIQYVYIFSAVALFILLIACINFMNLSTARSASRAKEVGIRKVLGTGRKSLVGQFLTESVLMVSIALGLAICIAALTMGFFNGIANKNLSLEVLLQPGYIAFIILLPIVVGALSGIYPAFFLSSFQPITVLKGKVTKGFRKNSLRSGLVVFQFFTTIVLIIATIVVYRQLNFIQNRSVGFDKEQVLVVATGALDANAEAFKNEVSKLAGVKGASFSGYLPVGNSSRSDATYATEAVMDPDNMVNLQTWNVDYEYQRLLNLEMASGRFFSNEFGSDSSGVVVNETAAKLLGFDDPIGKKLYITDEKNENGEVASLTIVGVVKNFNFESLRENIGPLCLRLGYNKWSTMFKVATSDLKSLLNQVEKTYKAMAPGMPFYYEFLDEAFDNMYRAEQRIGKIAITFAVLAILIACLGLFGLATYMAEQRTKEIGVRKVLGASVSSIVSMLSLDFTRLVAISAIIAFPVAWFVMNKWLQDFAFRVDFGWWIFALAGFLTLLIALLTVSVQAIRAALANPVSSLRNE